jgi:hypothetical protein
MYFYPYQDFIKHYKHYADVRTDKLIEVTNHLVRTISHHNLRRIKTNAKVQEENVKVKK